MTKVSEDWRFNNVVESIFHGDSEDPNFFVPIKVNILIMIDYSLEWEIILYTLELRSWVNFAIFTIDNWICITLEKLFLFSGTDKLHKFGS